jgi:uncharacterized SAM-binding protein YcdF (DUF218 family)
MFFILSKVFWLAITPFNIILLLLLVGCLLLFKKPKTGKKLIGTGLILVFMFGLEFIPGFMMGSLENRIPAGDIPDKIDGIIVLAGAVDMEASRFELIELNEQADRIVVGIILSKKHPEAKLILTGSSGNLKQDEKFIEADYLKRLSLLLGIDKEGILIERNSRNTHEHAVEMAKLLPKDGHWVLITSAFHMPRSFGCFRNRGLNVIPYPVDYKTKLGVLSNLSLTSFLPTSRNISIFSIALHEWFGLVTYRLMGYTDSLFPNAD